jgi:5-methyltetrahydropteroyltriglutamate--homocysteine methyltransferase
MPITTATVGSYPKRPHEGRPFRLGRAIEAFGSGQIDHDQLRRLEDDFVEEVIAEQVLAGIDLVTDGHVRWPDVHTPFAKKLAGFTVDGRPPNGGSADGRPHVTGTVGWGGPVTLEGWQFASSVSNVPVKQVVTGPYSLVKRSENVHYSSERELTLDVARVLNQEAFELEAAGCTYIQFDEPGLAAGVGPPEAGVDFGLVAEAADILTNGIAATTELRTYYGSVRQVPQDFFALPFRVFGLDLVEGPDNWDLVKQFPGGRTLAAGIVNGRGDTVEPEDAVADAIRRLLESVPPERLHVTPTCGLASLRREHAEAKLVRLARAARTVV